MKRFIILAVLALVPGIAGAATLGSLTIEDNAFADGIQVTSGTLRTYDSANPGVFDTVTPAAAGSGSNVNTGIWCSASCAFDVLFLDNSIVNGVGADFVVFEGGANESLSVTINSTTLVLAFDADIEEAGFLDAEGFQVGYWMVDLSDFGIASGDGISSIAIDLLYGDRGRTGEFASADLVAVGGLNSAVVPVPPSFALAFAGLGALAWVGRRRG